MTSIAWLASYPKSGNTWLRILLANLLSPRPLEPVSINDLEGDGIASWLGLISQYAALDPAELTAEEITALRPRIYSLMASEASRTIVMKIHDAYVDVAPDQPLVPVDATRSVVYIVRNPLDVAVSVAHHNGIGMDRAVATMGDPEYVIGRRIGQFAEQSEQRLLTWSAHVESWTRAPMPLHLLRYEDLQADTARSFASVAEFLGLSHDGARVQRAVENSAFDQLRAQEDEHGFRERPPSGDRFFRRGQIGGWRDELNEAQVARIIADHGAVMRRLGYLDDAGQPTC